MAIDRGINKHITLEWLMEQLNGGSMFDLFSCDYSYIGTWTITVGDTTADFGHRRITGTDWVIADSITMDIISIWCIPEDKSKPPSLLAYVHRG